MELTGCPAGAKIRGFLEKSWGSALEKGEKWIYGLNNQERRGHSIAGWGGGHDKPLKIDNF